MANPKHLGLLNLDVQAWNAWRRKNPDVGPNLAQLSQLAGFEGQNAFVFKGGLRKVFTTERARESVGRTVRR